MIPRVERVLFHRIQSLIPAAVFGYNKLLGSLARPRLKSQAGLPALGPQMGGAVAPPAAGEQGAARDG